MLAKSMREIGHPAPQSLSASQYEGQLEEFQAAMLYAWRFAVLIGA